MNLFLGDPFREGNIGNLIPSNKSVQAEGDKLIKSEEVKGVLSSIRDGFTEMSDAFNVVPDVFKDKK